jgi:hypothetical protein
MTFLSIIALLCGCISIVYPLEGIDKKTWIRNSSIGDFINNTSGEIFGLAYGINDLKYAEDTIHLAENQFNNLKDYCIKQPTIYDVLLSHLMHKPLHIELLSLSCQLGEWMKF